MQTAARVAVSRLRLVLEAETASRQTLELTRTVGSLLPESSSMIGDARIIRDLGGPCTRMRLGRIAEPSVLTRKCGSIVVRLALSEPRGNRLGGSRGAAVESCVYRQAHPPLMPPSTPVSAEAIPVSAVAVPR